MTISFDIPAGIEQAIGRSGRDAAAELKEAGLVELYRLGRISHGELAEGLGLSRAQADEVLKRHKFTEDVVTREELDAQLAQLRKLTG